MSVPARLIPAVAAVGLAAMLATVPSQAAPLRTAAPPGPATLAFGESSRQVSPHAVESFSTAAILLSTAATSATNAWAVGYTGTASVILHWDGTNWTQSNLAPGLLTSVAAISVDDAWAVGQAVTGDVSELIFHWNGKTWRREYVQPADSAQLYGVSATSQSNVWVVGFAGSLITNIALHMVGDRWYVVPLPALTEGAELTGVAAAADGTAWAFGFGSGTGESALIMRWHDDVWKVIPHPSRGAWINVNDIAVGPHGTAWAVGAIYMNKTGTAYVPLSMFWNGKTWRIVPVPVPKSAPADSSLSAATFFPDGTVWAVGGAGNSTLIMHWTGKVWVQVNSPGEVDLRGITATSDSNAWAVGENFATGGLILHWNGRTWS